jgi:hypothetical protein
MSNIGFGEESGENIAKLTSHFKELLKIVGYSEDELKQFDNEIKDSETDIGLLTRTMEQYLAGSGNTLSITNKLTSAEETLN